VTISRLSKNQLVGQYRIISHIARGGMADVYLAEDIDLKRKVALKVMLDFLAEDPQFVQRFRREAQTVAKLEHPNIVQVYSTGLTSTNQPYIAMQYIEGGSLQTKLEQLEARGKLLTTVQALNITRQLALALDVAHNAGIVHRDLKPSNVLVRPDGTPVLVDLGIVLVGGGSKLTQTGSLIGTPSYMSPDQIRDLPLDGRSDLYSLGIILYEMLTGRRPFDAEETIAVLHKQVYEEPIPIYRLRTDLSLQSQAIVETCLKKEREERYPTAADLVQAIDQAFLAEGVLGPDTRATQVLTTLHDSSLISRQKVVRVPTEEKPTIKRGMRPRRKIPAWLITTLFVLAAVSLFFGYQLFRGDSDPPTTTVAIAPTPNETAVLAMTIVARSTIDSQETAVALAKITEEPEATTTPTPSDTPIPTDTATPTDTPSPSSMPVARLQPGIVFQSNRDGDFEIFVMDLDGSNQIQLTDNQVDDNYPVVTLDGSKILFETYRDGNWEIYTMNIDGSDQRRLTNMPQSKERLPTWSPDGNQIAYLSNQNGEYEIYIMNADGSNPYQVTFTDFPEGHVSWSANNRLVYNADPGSGSSWEIYTIGTNGQNQQQLTSNSVSDWSPEWSPDGRTILYLSIVGDNDPAIFIMNADGTDQRLLYNSPQYEWGADWSVDGTRIIFTKDEDDFNNLYIMDADGRNLQFLTNRAAYPSWVNN